MSSILRRVTDPFMLRMVEQLKADLARQQATTDYIAMMADVEIPTEEEGDSDVV